MDVYRQTDKEGCLRLQHGFDWMFGLEIRMRSAFEERNIGLADVRIQQKLVSPRLTQTDLDKHFPIIPSFVALPLPCLRL